MIDLLNFSTATYNAICKFFIWFLGDFNNQFYTLFVFIIIDFILGLLCDLARKRFSQDNLKQCIIKKIAIFIVVGLANIIDTNLTNDMTIIRSLALNFYASYEALSVLSHLSEVGLPVPKCLMDLLNYLHICSNNSGSNTN